MRVLITGANGFVGSSLFKYLKDKTFFVRGTVRKPKLEKQDSNLFVVPSLDGETDWTDALNSCDTVIHLAAQAHTSNKKRSEESKSYIKYNTEATINLAKQAAKKGIKKFIFLSSTGVMGPQVTDGFSYTRHSKTEPHDSYTRSKLYAERGLYDLSKTSEMKIIIIRAPVVYGPNAPGSIGSLTKAISLNIPLPLASANNKRHLISLDNLMDLILCSITTTLSKYEIFLASDNRPISISELCHICGTFIDKKPILIHFPLKILFFFANIFNKQKKAETLLLDFDLDIKETISMLNWLPRDIPDRHLKYNDK